jgi:hypothetical protein
MTTFLDPDDVESDDDICRCTHPASDHYIRRGFTGPTEYCAGSTEFDICQCPGFEEVDE